jgi:kynureninase
MSGLDMREDIWRYAGGTPNVPALYAGISGAEIINDVGVEAIRRRHIELGSYAVERAQEEGLTVNSPLDARVRGGHVTVDFPGAAAACNELIRRKFIVDYRPGSGIRVAPHFYNTREEVDAVFGEIRSIIRAA